MQRKIPRRIVDGVLLLDKPSGMTSNAALQTARRLLNAAKAGHTGTLDPMASGLLPLTFGEATKFSQILLDADKTYEAGVRLGITTDTGDADGTVLTTHPVSVTREELDQVLARFRGEIDQLPPMYSALKRDGKPLYEYARAGIEIEREVRRVKIHALKLIDFSGAHFRLRVRCSKGTYIRTLAMDIGAALGCGAHLDALRRTAIGDFDVARAVALDALEANPVSMRDSLLEPVDALVAHFPRIELASAEATAILQGRELRRQEEGQGSARLFCGDRFLGIAEWHAGSLRPKRLIATQTGQ